MLLLRAADGTTCAVKDDEPRAGCALIDGSDVLAQVFCTSAFKLEKSHLAGERCIYHILMNAIHILRKAGLSAPIVNGMGG